MLLKTYYLEGSCKREFDTEIKFNLASAKYDCANLVKFSIKKRDDDSENCRLISCISKVLSSLKKQGTVDFYVKPEQMEQNTTEASYITNLLGGEIKSQNDRLNIYVKI